MMQKRSVKIPVTPILYSESAAYAVDTKAAFTIKRSCSMFDEPDNTIPVVVSGDDKQYRGAVPWGEDNDLPDKVIAIISKNPIASRCLEFRINLAYGSGPKFGHKNDKGELVEYTDKEIAENKELQEIQLFWENNDIDSFYSEILTDGAWFYNPFYQVITDKNNPESRKITELAHIEASFSRWESANTETGKVENHFFSTDWGNYNNNNNSCIIATPVIWAKNPIVEMKKQIIKNPEQYTYVLPIRLPSPGKKYYQRPYYYSIIDSGWMDFANAIPEFKRALMKNQITVKYHIEIHEKYFQKIFSKEKLDTKEKQDARVKKEFAEINKFLKGSDNAGKTMITYYRIDHGSKTEISDIKIKILDSKLGGEYIEDSQEASAMTYVAMGVHPSLVGVIPGKTSSNLSGTDKRELLRIDQTLLARPRDSYLKPLYLVKAINKWPREVHFWFPDLILTTLDQGREVQAVPAT